MKNILYFYGKDILSSEGMQLEKKFIQHGDVSCYDHSVRVAAKSVEIVKKFRLKVNMKALIREHFCTTIFCMTGMIQIQVIIGMVFVMRGLH